jgi:hypothetical protein
MTSSSDIDSQIALQTDQGTQSDQLACDLQSLKDQSVSFSSQKQVCRGHLRPTDKRKEWKFKQEERCIKLRRVQSLGRDMNRSIYKAVVKGNSALPPIRSKDNAGNQALSTPFRAKASLISPLTAYSRKQIAYPSWCPSGERPGFRLRRRVFLEINGVRL